MVHFQGQLSDQEAQRIRGDLIQTKGRGDTPYLQINFRTQLCQEKWTEKKKWSWR